MSPITKELGIIINLKEELNSLMGIITQLNQYYQSHLQNTNIHGILVVINNFKIQLPNIITKINDLWTSYLHNQHCNQSDFWKRSALIPYYEYKNI